MKNKAWMWSLPIAAVLLLGASATNKYNGIFTGTFIGNLNGSASTTTTATNLAGPIASAVIGTAVVSNLVADLSKSTNYSGSNVVGSVSLASTATNAASGGNIVTTNDGRVFTLSGVSIGGNAATASSVSLAVTNVAGLTTPAAGTYPSYFCTNAITTKGVGSTVQWDGSQWRTSEGIIPTADLTNFSVLAYQSGALSQNSVTYCGRNWMPAFDNGSTYSWAGPLPFIRSGFAIWTAFGMGVSVASDGGYLTGPFLPVNNVNLLSCSSYNMVWNIQATNNYWCIAACLSDSANTAYPTEGAFWIYDPFTNKTTGVISGVSTNDWICAVAHGSVYGYYDSGLPGTLFSASANPSGNLLTTVISTNSVVFLTNGVAALTVTTNHPTLTGIYYSGHHYVKKQSGGTPNFYFAGAPGVFYRFATPITPTP